VFDRRFILKAMTGAAVTSAAGCTRIALSERTLLPSQEETWELMLRMNALGPRYTGAPAHHAFIDMLAEGFERLGLDVRSEEQRFTRWDARRVSLTVTVPGSSPEDIEIASAYPYSGPTPAQGVEGRLVDGGSATAPRLPDDLSDAILYLDAPVPTLPFGEWYESPRTYGDLAALPQAVSHAAAQIVTAPNLEEYARRGAKGVILGWTTLSEAHVRHQYIPFNRPMQSVAGVWVGPGAAARLKALARSGAQATLTLDAEITPNAASRTIYAELSGASRELLILNTHTDGPNAVEENGPIAILALARRLTRLPASERRRSVLFLLASGHFVGPQVESTEGFVKAHPDLLERTAAALGVEHLGALEWADLPDGTYGPTGLPETSLFFSKDERLAAHALAVARGKDVRGAILDPMQLSYFFGEGRPLARAGVPTIGFLPAPSYLLASPPNGAIDRVDPKLMYAQIQMLAELLDRLDASRDLSPANVKAR
jgi:hypothetical protein